MYAHEEAAFEKKAEKMLAGHRMPPDGRNIFAFRMRSLDNSNYRENFDNTFPDAPGSPGWFEKRFAEKEERKGLKTGFHGGRTLFGKRKSN